MKFFETALFFFMCLTAFPVSAQIPPNFKGDFQSELRFSAGQGPVAIVVGDLNGDGRLDVVVADYNGNGVSVLLETVTEPSGVRPCTPLGTTLPRLP